MLFLRSIGTNNKPFHFSLVLKMRNSRGVGTRFSCFLLRYSRFSKRPFALLLYSSQKRLACLILQFLNLPATCLIPILNMINVWLNGRWEVFSPPPPPPSLYPTLPSGLAVKQCEECGLTCPDLRCFDFVHFAIQLFIRDSHCCTVVLSCLYCISAIISIPTKARYCPAHSTI